MLAIEGVDEELRAALAIQDEALIHEREAWPEAGSVDDEIEFFAGPVGEIHAFAVRPLDAWLGHDPPMHDMIEIEGAGGGMRLEQLVIRSGQIVLPMRSDGDAQAPPIEIAHHGARQRPAAGLVDEGVGRLAQHELGEEIIASPHRMHGARPVMGGVVENIDRGVSGADHEHALALELLFRFYVVGVEDLAGEAAWVARPVWVPMMAVGDNETVIEARLRLAFDLDAPAPVDPLCRRYARIEFDVVVEAELARVGAEIVLRVGPAQIMRPLLREIVVRIFRQLFGGVKIGRAVDHVRALRVPNAADVGERLEAVERDATLDKGLNDRESAGACADDAILFHHSPPKLPLLSPLSPHG